MEKYDIVKQAKISNLIIYSFMVAVGLAMLIFREIPTNVETIILSVLCILVGGAKILGYFSNDLYRLAFQFDLAIGLFLAIIGVLTLVVGNKDPLGTVRLFGIYIFIDGLLKLQTAFDAKKFGIARWLVILLTAILMVGVGIVGLLASYLEQISQLIVLDVALMLDGLVNIWVTAYTVRIRAKKKNLEERFGLKE
ncbi:uncharacterized protein BN743_00379 [Clostridium sp. CAG:632]|nr:uncharacterized protein BN743_00379 [Clostridium sp. CAG:632]